MEDDYTTEAEIDAILAECWGEVPVIRELPEDVQDELEAEAA